MQLVLKSLKVLQSSNIQARHGWWEMLELSNQNFGYVIDHVKAKKLDIAYVSMGVVQVL